MPKKLTEETALLAKPGDILWSSERLGLHLRVTPKGTKTFLLGYRHRGKQYRPKIGEYPLISVEQATLTAEKLLVDVWSNRVSSGKTVEMVFWTHSHKNYWSQTQFTDSGWENQVKLLFKNHIKPFFGDKALCLIHLKDVKAWHQKMRQTPVTANRSLSVLSTIFRHAIELGWTDTNPCLNVRKHPEISRRRFASQEELKAINKVLNNEFDNNPKKVLFIWLIMFTGMRPRHLERVKWTDVIMRSGELCVEFKGKNSTEVYVIPDHLKQSINRHCKHREYIFGMSTPHVFWRRVCFNAGVEGLWLRDLRRTFASVGYNEGVGIDKIAEILNHKTVQTTKIYAKLFDSTRNNVAKQIVNKIKEIVQ